MICDVLSSSLADDVNRFWLDDIGTTMTTVHCHGVGPFGPWSSFGLLTGYAAVELIIGGVLLVRRDA
jgi:hypothetical protein